MNNMTSLVQSTEKTSFAQIRLIVIFYAIFIMRPFIDAVRLLQECPEIVQFLVDFIGIAVSCILMFIFILKQKLLVRSNLVIIMFIGLVILTVIFHEKDLMVVEIVLRIISPLAFMLFPQVILRSEKDPLCQGRCHKVFSHSCFYRISCPYIGRYRS